MATATAPATAATIVIEQLDATGGVFRRFTYVRPAADVAVFLDRKAQAFRMTSTRFLVDGAAVAGVGA